MNTDEDVGVENALGYLIGCGLLCALIAGVVLICYLIWRFFI